MVVLNPWGLLADNVGEASSYNPLDILADKKSIHLVDDVQVIAEMLVPVSNGDKDKFFTDSARSVIAGLLLHLATTQTGEKRTLKTLWEWARLGGDDWKNLLLEMATNFDPVNGEVVRNAANEILKLMEAGEKTFGSIIATVLQNTDFLKSPALQQSLQSGYNPAELSDGNTALYVIIPADKLASHSRWLRLVVVSTLRAVVRKSNKRVTFLLDEFAALGYISEIEVALSTYAGFNVTVWPILQSLIQLKGLYGDNWESFTGNTTIKQYFSINDNFTADYVSNALGKTSNVISKENKNEVNERPLVTPDEVRRYSGDNIFAFFGSMPPTYFPKRPYYVLTELNNPDGTKRYDENPYFK